jgi:hypothetical protein
VRFSSRPRQKRKGKLGMAQPLERELKTYEEQRDHLLGLGEGKYVLIHADQVAGIFESQADAISQGYERFGNVAFLVRQIVKVETPIFMTSYLLSV